MKAQSVLVYRAPRFQGGRPVPCTAMCSPVTYTHGAPAAAAIVALPVASTTAFARTTPRPCGVATTTPLTRLPSTKAPQPSVPYQRSAPALRSSCRYHSILTWLFQAWPWLALALVRAAQFDQALVQLLREALRGCRSSTSRSGPSCRCRPGRGDTRRRASWPPVGRPRCRPVRRRCRRRRPRHHSRPSTGSACSPAFTYVVCGPTRIHA